MFEALLSKVGGGGSDPPGVWVPATAGTKSYIGKMIAIGTDLFVFGGTNNTTNTNVIRKFNTVTKVWSNVGTLPWTADSMVACVIDGLIYVHGGGDGSTRFGNLVSFNPANNQITVLMAGIASRGATGCAINGKFYVYGGTTTVTINTLRVYDPVTNAWTTLTPGGTAPGGKFYAGGGAVNNKFYIVGGAGATGGAWDKSINIYDPVANAWETSIPMSFGMYANVCAVIDDKIYTAGGAEESVGVGAYVKTTRVFDTIAKSWTVLAPQAKALAYQTEAVISGKIYAFGGYSVSEGAVADLNTFIPG